MFTLAIHPSSPIKRSLNSNTYCLGIDRGMPPPLAGDASDYLVEQTCENDPANAKSWPFSRKLRSASVLGFNSVVTAWGSSVYSAAVEPVSVAFGVSRTVAILGLTL
jgi:MFS transporter, DHA1 family, multidrug resistance protein